MRMTTGVDRYSAIWRSSRRIHIGVIWFCFTNTSMATQAPELGPATRPAGLELLQSSCSKAGNRRQNRRYQPLLRTRNVHVGAEPALSDRTAGGSRMGAPPAQRSGSSADFRRALLARPGEGTRAYVIRC